MSLNSALGALILHRHQPKHVCCHVESSGDRQGGESGPKIHPERIKREGERREHVGEESPHREGQRDAQQDEAFSDKCLVVILRHDDATIHHSPAGCRIIFLHVPPRRKKAGPVFLLGKNDF